MNELSKDFFFFFFESELKQVKQKLEESLRIEDGTFRDMETSRNQLCDQLKTLVNIFDYFVVCCLLLPFIINSLKKKKKKKKRTPM